MCTITRQLVVCFFFHVHTTYVSSEVNSWRVSDAVQCLRPPLVGWDLESVNGRSSVPKLRNLLCCLHMPN